MIKSFTASTREIDDSAAAIAEIKAAFEGKLLKNSLGLISYFSEFEETGVLKAVCDALPFDCIGSTSCLCSAGKQTDQIILTITVLTSDDCSFETIVLPITEKYDESINSALSPVINRSGEKPALILSYFPLMNTVSGDMILAAIDKVTGGIPLFGTTSIDHNMNFSAAKTMRNGEAFRESAVLGLLYGDFNYSFGVASIDKSKIRSQKAVITESDGNILIGVNDKSVVEYLEEIGLSTTELANGLAILPLVVDHKDGTKHVARAVFTLTPEGHAVCGGAMPVGATLAIGRIVPEDVLNTTEESLKPLVDKDSVVLSYSCMARYHALGTDYAAEAKKVSELAGDMRYMFACSGGEICPLPDASGKLKNFYHNYTNVFCRLS
ncbi:MAG: FIST C-terminal domain-containing protein [Endomicrobia bacterium]|nr:FIST C-terminal domain-containing protein [Endomicrobiia bacterium]MCL2799266.1 FIST C-terminal domain-containing protein [Endomicrobiia bacterium]